jgi:lauroyl/myristoyl acyltransferase
MENFSQPLFNTPDDTEEDSNRPMMEVIVDFVRQHPCIYDLTHRHYKNKTYKDSIWAELSRVLDVPGW